MADDFILYALIASWAGVSIAIIGMIFSGQVLLELKTTKEESKNRHNFVISEILMFYRKFT